jgi:hypothetical protein
MQRIGSSQRNRIDPEKETFRFAVYRSGQFQPIKRPGIRVLENCIANLAGTYAIAVGGPVFLLFVAVLR